jgi:peptide/nickel transport system permease protein
MRVARTIALVFLVLVATASVAAGWLSPHNPGTQFRDSPNVAPSARFPLGTDALGRDRWSRLLYATRISLSCAPVAAAAAVLLGSAVGLVSGLRGGWIDESTCAVTDLVLSLPWLFLLLTLRAVLPLNVSPAASVAATFVLLILTGWAPGARVVRNAVRQLRSSGPIQYARACGCSTPQLLRVHVLPNLRPVIVAQFWVLVPVFLLTEANLGMLGLGVTEPMPSWGNMLAELRQYDRIPEAPWILAPAVLLVLVVASLHVAVAERPA